MSDKYIVPLSIAQKAVDDEAELPGEMPYSVCKIIQSGDLVRITQEYRQSDQVGYSPAFGG